MNSTLLILTLLHSNLQLPSLFYANTANIPAIGDSASYSINVAQNGSVMNGTEVTTITAIDVSGQVTLSDELTYGGTSQTDTGQATLETLNALASIIDHCGEMTGLGETASLENTIVPAGTFQTCHISNSSGEFYLGQVPLGTVKMILRSDDGTVHTTELTSFIKK